MSSNTNTHSAVFPLIHAKNSADGLSKPISCDGNGNLQSTIVNTINVAPANNTNSGLTNDPANSLAVGLRGRTDIADASTETFINCDNTGKLIISNTQNQGVKLEDLSSTINSDHANHSRSIAVGLRGRTNITDATTGKFLLCDANGVLNTTQGIVRDTQNITTDYAGSNLSGSLPNGTSTASCDVSNHKHLHILVDGSGGGGSLTLEGSHTNTNTSYHLVEELAPQVGLSGTYFKTKIINAVYPHYRITNNSGNPITFTYFTFTKLNL
jgi:hypothetical protein